MSLSAIARRVGVSTSTVSRYVKGELRVSPTTEAKIRAVMEELGYEGAGGPERAVALVIPELTNPYFAELAEQFAVQASRRGLETSIQISGGSVRREVALLEQTSRTASIGGTVFVSMGGDPEALRSVAPGHPVVILDERLEGTDVGPYVGADSRGGAYQATTYLISLGHKCIAHLAGPLNLESSQRRRQGYEEALRDHGLEPRADLVEHGPYSESFGANVLPTLMRRPEPPTAVFACSDIVAIGLMSAADMHGLSIPEDLSVVGFDGIGVGAWLRPRLATVVQPYEEMVQRTLDLIAASRAGNSPATEELLPMLLRPAESAARRG